MDQPGVRGGAGPARDGRHADFPGDGLLEDTHMDGVPTIADYTAGPLAAVERFLETGGNKDFDVDYSREMFMVSLNPGGWLRRK